MARNVVAQEHAGDGVGHDRRRATGAALCAGAEKLGLSGEIGTGGIAAEVKAQTANLIESYIVEIKQARSFWSISDRVMRPSSSISSGV